MTPLEQLAAAGLFDASMPIQPVQRPIGPDAPVFPAGSAPRAGFWSLPGSPNYSTHLNMITDHPMLPGRFTMMPAIVPGQVGMDRLLQGQPMDRPQLGRAREDARQRMLGGEMLPVFQTPDEGLAFEQQWRKDAPLGALQRLAQ